MERDSGTDDASDGSWHGRATVPADSDGDGPRDPAIRSRDSPRGRDAPGGERPSARERQQNDRPGWTDRLPAPTRESVTAGVGAFVAGYVLTGVAFALEVLTATDGGGSGAGGVVQSIVDQLFGLAGREVVAASGGEVPLALRTVGWTFFSAHGVPLSGAASGLGQTLSGTVDVLTLAKTVPDVPLTPSVYYLIPPVVLASAGWLLAERARASSLSRGALAGGQLVVGYLPCVAAAGVLLALTVDVSIVATVTAGPDLASAVLRGTGYAVVAGGIGGLLRTLKTEA